VSLGRFRSHFSAELSERNSAIFILINLINELVNLLLSDIESTRLNHSAELVLGDATGLVEVQRVESFIYVEARVALKSLSDTLTGVLSAEMNSAQVAEVGNGGRVEAVFSSVEWTSVVIGMSAVNHRGVVCIKSKECFAQFTESKSSVSVLIISGNEEFQFVVSRVNTHSVESLTELVRGNPSVIVLIEDSESIVQIEVRFHSDGSLCGLEFSLNVDDLLKSANELIFILQVEDGLSGRRASNSVGAAVHWAWASNW